jgi:hypothetical protein
VQRAGVCHRSRVATINENLKTVKAKIQRYHWLLQTNLTKARRKLVAEMLGEQKRELKKQEREL